MRNPTEKCPACGRTGIHCPYCGGKSRYFVKNDSREEPLTGETVRAFCCRLCGQKYHELMPCQAPPREPSKAELARASKEQVVAAFRSAKGITGGESREEMLRKIFSK